MFFLVYLGQERVRGLNRVYFKGSSGALVVYDVTNGSTLDGALNWKHELDGQVMLKNGRPIPAVLLANKCDETNVCRRNASLLEKLPGEGLHWMVSDISKGDLIIIMPFPYVDQFCIRNRGFLFKYILICTLFVMRS